MNEFKVKIIVSIIYDKIYKYPSKNKKKKLKNNKNNRNFYQKYKNN